MTDMFYPDTNDGYEVEVFDHVEIKVDGMIAEGQVVKLHPKDRQLSVRYEDHLNAYRTTGNPRVRTIKMPLAEVVFAGRDG